jgi:hypothetical protein
MVAGSGLPAATTLRGWPLEAARATCLGVAVLTLGLVAAGFVAGFRDPALISQPTVRVALAGAGVPLRLTIAIGLLVPTVVSAVTAAVLFWRRSDDRMALLFALFLVLFGSFESRALSALRAAHPGARPLIGLVSVATGVVGVLLLCVFPDGRFVPRWTAVLPLAAIPAFASMPDMLTTLQRLPDPLGVPAWREACFLAVLAGSVGLGTAAQGWRYWRVSSPVQRQQAKWVAFTLAGYELVLVGGLWAAHRDPGDQLRADRAGARPARRRTRSWHSQPGRRRRDLGRGRAGRAAAAPGAGDGRPAFQPPPL